jgi:hypothetical protein
MNKGFTEQVCAAVTIWTPIHEVPGSNLCLDISYPECSFGSLLQFRQPNARVVSRIGHDHCLKNRLKFVGFEVLTAVVMMSTVFCDITSCSPISTDVSEEHIASIFRVEE